MLSTDLYRTLLEGASITIQVWALAAAWGTAVAVVLGVVGLSPNRLVRAAVRVYVEVLRGVSAIILLFWVFFAMPIFLDISLTPMQAGVLALGLNLSAYGTEIVRGAVQAVPRGQTEASIAVNLSYWHRVKSVILPQAAITILPPYGSLLIEVLKASALVSLIDLADIMYEANVMRNSRSADDLDIYLAVLILYFAISLAITGCVRLLERYFGRGLGIRGMAGTVK